MTDHRWPVAPLLDVPSVTDQTLRRLLHVSGATYDRMRADGLTDQQADRAATRLGMHPDRIWPGWSTSGLTVIDQLRLDGGWRPAWLYREAS